jgi:hypothetical protein
LAFVLLVSTLVRLILSPATAEDAKVALNLAVTQATIGDTICSTGWTRTVRPYVGEMKRIKAEMLATIGEPIEHRNRCELDHVIPLALGGDPIDRRNLAFSRSTRPARRTPSRYATFAAYDFRLHRHAGQKLGWPAPAIDI